MANDKGLFDSIDSLVDILSFEGNLEDYGNGLYVQIIETNVDNISLELSVQVIGQFPADSLLEAKTLWCMSLYDIKDNNIFGFIAYGENWGDNYDIREDLQDINQDYLNGKPIEKCLVPMTEYHQWVNQRLAMEEKDSSLRSVEKEKHREVELDKD